MKGPKAQKQNQPQVTIDPVYQPQQVPTTPFQQRPQMADQRQTAAMQMLQRPQGQYR